MTSVSTARVFDSDHPLVGAARAIGDRLAAWRRHLHAHPERSGQEVETARFVAAELKRLGLDPVTNYANTQGVVADINAGNGPALALRADMDALPITEETGVDYASTNPGVMHACGHDAHMAMLLGAATLLNERRDDLPHPVRLIFQPSEELWPGGAKPMIDGGVLNGVDKALGLHIWSQMPLGTLGTRVGPFMSSVNDLHITVHGKGGHAAMPQQCVDPVLVAAEIIVALQSVVSRGLAMSESAVVSVTQFHSGTACNVIPETATLHGTVRTLGEPTRSTVVARIRQVAMGVAQAHGATVDVEVPAGYPALINDAGMVEAALATARELGFADDDLLDLAPQGGGEDFAYFAEQVPAAFLFLGAHNETKGCTYPHHHPRFNIDEEALPLGSALLARFALTPW